jgi:hypothetical protein
MTHYLELTFTLNATSIFGLGERLTNFKLADGSYTLFSKGNDKVKDDGTGGKQ